MRSEWTPIRWRRRTRPPRSSFRTAHADGALVAPIVRLLRASRSFVYLDSDSIRPGKEWREELEAAISNVNVVIVFWCCHSHASAEVGKEVSAAIESGKDVLPLLLDATTLPQWLSQYQYIDFRDAVGPAHSAAPEETRAPPLQAAMPRHRGPRFILGSVFAAVLAVSVCLTWYFELEAPNSSSPNPPVVSSPLPTPSDPTVTPSIPVEPKVPPKPAPPPPPEPPSYFESLASDYVPALALIAIALAVGIGIARSVLGHRLYRKPSAGVLVPESSQAIARRIESELRRFLSPEGASFSVKLGDAGMTVSRHPAGATARTDRASRDQT